MTFTRNKLNDPMLQLGRNTLRQANISLFQTTSRRLLYKTKGKSANPLDAALNILAAEILRAAGKNQDAVNIVRSIIANPPTGARDILSQAERLMVSLLLDAGDVQTALSTAAGIDAMVIESSEPGASVTISHRNQEEVSIETFISEAEANVFARNLDKAVELLSAAVKRLADEEVKASGSKINSYELKKINARFSDLRYELHFWGAVVKIIGGDMSAYDTLGDLAAKLVDDSSADRRLLSRVRAVQGEFDINSQVPPLALGILEAMRLWRLVSEQTVEAAREELIAESSLSAPVGHNLAVSEFPTATVALHPSSPGQMPANLDEKFSLLIDKFSEVLDKLPLQSSAPVQKDTRRPFAFGGGFLFLDLCTLLSEAEDTGLTGFFLVQWNPDMIETTVLAGNISPLARAGEGFIFMREGVIIDACIGAYDPDPNFKSGTEHAEADAWNNLKILIQIGIRKKLDQEVDGFGEAYSSMAVKHRPSRLDFCPSMLFQLLQELDDDLREPV